jgi:LPXTG-motif cell wall-anchored protein
VDRGDPVSPGRPLARTGVDATLLAGIGALLLGAGVFAVRRRGGRDHEREDSRAGA